MDLCFFSLVGPKIKDLALKFNITKTRKLNNMKRNGSGDSCFQDLEKEKESLSAAAGPAG